MNLFWKERKKGKKGNLGRKEGKSEEGGKRREG